MRSDWCYWLNAVTPQQCDAIIESAIKLPKESPTLGYDSGIRNEDLRRSYVRWVYEQNTELNHTFDTMWKFLRVVNNDWFNFHVTHLPPMQFTEYDSEYKGEYKRHQDIFWINPSNRHRKISLVLQLTDPKEYIGGDLNIESMIQNPSDADRAAMRQRGTIIAFTSYLWHALEPLTAGRRHSLVAWFEGPKFQ